MKSLDALSYAETSSPTRPGSPGSPKFPPRFPPPMFSAGSKLTETQCFEISTLRNSPIPDIYNVEISKFANLNISKLQNLKIANIQDFKISIFQISKHQIANEFTASKIQTSEKLAGLDSRSFIDEHNASQETHLREMPEISHFVQMLRWLISGHLAQVIHLRGMTLNRPLGATELGQNKLD